jgi:hypothetical protein
MFQHLALGTLLEFFNEIMKQGGTKVACLDDFMGGGHSR